MESVPQASFDFWKNRWDTNNTGWHRKDVSESLVNSWPMMDIPDRSLILFPLCGKSLDILWVMAHGHCVVGVEFYEEPVRQLFAENQLEATVDRHEDRLVYQGLGGQLTVHVMDLFEFERINQEKFDVIIDRGSLVAIEKDLRDRYIKVLRNCLHDKGCIFAMTLQFDQNQFSGPPFSVSDSEFDILMKDNHLHHRYMSSRDAEKLGVTEVKEIATLITKA